MLNHDFIRFQPFSGAYYTNRSSNYRREGVARGDKSKLTSNHTRNVLRMLRAAYCTNRPFPTFAADNNMLYKHFRSRLEPLISCRNAETLHMTGKPQAGTPEVVEFFGKVLLKPSIVNSVVCSYVRIVMRFDSSSACRSVSKWYGTPANPLTAFKQGARTAVQIFIAQATDPGYLVGGCTALHAGVADM